MNIWLISDTHFAHENMYTFRVGPGGPRVRSRFQTAREGDEFMISAWNERVRPEDHVWHLGDVHMGRSSAQEQEFIRLIRSLHGHKRLVLGNHDHFKARVYGDAGFEKIRGSHRHDGLLYTHIPVHPDSLRDRRILANVHGHIHANPSPEGRYLNVSVEMIDYAPIAVEVVKDMARAMVERGER